MFILLLATHFVKTPTKLMFPPISSGTWANSNLDQGISVTLIAFRTGWVLLDSRFVPEEGRRCRPGPLVGGVASGFQRCNVPVHKDNILAGFGRTRVKIVVIEKERSRFRRKRQDEVRNSAGRVPLLQ